VTLVKVQGNGNILGGFASIPWPEPVANGNGKTADPDAFIFSVSRQEKYELISL